MRDWTSCWVEAGNRLGGQAHSITLPSPGNMVVDLGCAWLHSARRNPWTGLAESYGLTVDRSPANWRAQWRDIGFPPAEQQAFSQAWMRWQKAAPCRPVRPRPAPFRFPRPGRSPAPADRRDLGLCQWRAARPGVAA